MSEYDELIPNSKATSMEELRKEVSEQSEQERKLQEAYKLDDEHIATMMFTNFLIWLRSEQPYLQLKDVPDDMLRAIARSYIIWANNATDAALTYMLQNGE
jgi:hypothetical protein